MVKDYEAIPFVHNEVKYLLDSKEAELIKKRNSDLYKIKELEKQLTELRKALKVLEMQSKNFTTEKIEQLNREIEETKAKTETEELHTLILNHVVDRNK